MSLLLASARWGNGEGIYNYNAEAQKILKAMLSKTESSNSYGIVTNIFNKTEKEVVFVPVGNADYFTDPSYHLPHFYELWSRWADTNNNFWCEVAAKSRMFLKKAVNPVTGLAPDYAAFDGKPFKDWGGGQQNFMYDAWRVGMNVAVDYQWFAKNEWEVTECSNLQNFFYSKGIKNYVGLYTLEGNQIGNDHNGGLIAMNAVSSIASKSKYRKDFIEEFWNLKIPSGHYRYYDGMLYMLAMLQVSGNFKVYNLTGKPTVDCSGRSK